MTRDEVEAVVWAYLPRDAPDLGRRVAQIMAAIDAYTRAMCGPDAPLITEQRRAEIWAARAN